MKKLVALFLFLSAISLTACMPDDQSTYSESESSNDVNFEEATQ